MTSNQLSTQLWSIAWYTIKFVVFAILTVVLVRRPGALAAIGAMGALIAAIANAVLLREIWNE